MILIFRHLFCKNFIGCTVWPFIILKSAPLKEDPVLINHEKIHLAQQRELLVVLFFIIYLLEWCVKTLWYLDGYKGYRNISFEREAYRYEQTLSYLENRKPYHFIKYL